MPYAPEHHEEQRGAFSAGMSQNVPVQKQEHRNKPTSSRNQKFWSGQRVPREKQTLPRKGEQPKKKQRDLRRMSSGPGCQRQNCAQCQSRGTQEKRLLRQRRSKGGIRERQPAAVSSHHRLSIGGPREGIQTQTTLYDSRKNFPSKNNKQSENSWDTESIPQRQQA